MKKIKYQINKNNINFNGENLNEKKWNWKGKDYCLNGELYFEGEKEKNMILMVN